ncbi:MAG: hypothetical protein JNN32_05270 [Flavobacteriales bacterium]|nr:hypothetical protein [Flavobacteriales bacterium]
MESRSTRPLIWLLVPLGSIAFSLLYFLVLMPVKASPGELALFERGIGSPLLKVLNGYFGSFFNLRFLGNTVCWAMPILLILAFRWRSLVGWQRGALLFLSLAVLIIGGAGGFNYRYALTLLPALLVLVFVVVDKGMVRSGATPSLRTSVHVLLVLVTVANSQLSMDLSSRMALADPVERPREMNDDAFYTKFDTGPENLDQWLDHAGVRPSDRVLVNNLPVYFYVTDRPGLYYWCGADQYFGPNGEEPIFRTRTDDEVVRYMIDELWTRFIFSDRNLSRYDLRFERFLETHCKLLAEDDKGHTLHVLKDTFGR